MPAISQVAAWLRAHPVQPSSGQGSVAQPFQTMSGRRRPVLEFLVQGSRDMWFVRWPNGSVRWESGPDLIGRGFTLPAHAILGVDEGPSR